MLTRGASLQATPKWAPRPRFGRSDGASMLRALELMAFDPYPWQYDVARLSLEVADDGGYRFGTVGVCVGRQNGKTALVLGRVVMEMVRGGRSAYTAQDRILAREKWQEYAELLIDLLPRSMVRNWSRSNGQEHLTLRTGGRFGIASPSRKSGRGRSNDLIVVDEALTHESMAAVAALQPTLATKPNGQMWLLGNAGDFRAVMFRHYRDLGRAGEEDRLCWIEYAPDDPECAIDDEVAWAQAIPTLNVEGGVSRVAVRDASRTMAADDFRREYLNVWDDDIDDGRDLDDRLAPEVWESLCSPRAVPSGRLAFAVDSRPDRSSTVIVAASLSPATIEVVEVRPGVDWAVARCAALVERHGGVVAYDGGGQAATVGSTLAAQGVSVVRAPVGDVQQASALLWDYVQSRELAVRPHALFDEGVQAARKGRSGDRWRWVRESDSADITAIVAASLALFASRRLPEPMPRPEVF